MTSFVIGSEVFYIVLGAFWWHRIVVPGPACEPEDWRLDLAQAAQRGDVALLIVKGAFVLMWPLALGAGWMLAKRH